MHLLLEAKILDLSDVQLPTNKRFGFFFVGVCALATFYCYAKSYDVAAYGSGALSLTFLFLTLATPERLTPLNIAWIKLGLLIGRIVSPLVLGAVFFFIFTPVAIISRLLGRDELRIRTGKKPTYWRRKVPSQMSESFEKQY